MAKQLQYLDSIAFCQRNRVKLWSTFVALLPHKVPTEEVEPAAGNNRVTETPAVSGPTATASQESVGAVYAVTNAKGTTTETEKQTYVLGEPHFDKLNVKAGLKDQLAYLVKENLDAFAGFYHDLGHKDLVVH